MRITQAEIIQLLRRRARMNQGDFGAAAFRTSYESGRTKIKNIELGKQIPTAIDLANMARVLKVRPEALEPQQLDATHDGVRVPRKVLESFPGLEAYLDMLVKAVTLDDRELAGYLAAKLGRLFSETADRYAMSA